MFCSIVDSIEFWFLHDQMAERNLASQLVKKWLIYAIQNVVAIVEMAGAYTEALHGSACVLSIKSIRSDVNLL